MSRARAYVPTHIHSALVALTLFHCRPLPLVSVLLSTLHSPLEWSGACDPLPHRSYWHFRVYAIRNTSDKATLILFYFLFSSCLITFAQLSLRSIVARIAPKNWKKGRKNRLIVFLYGGAAAHVRMCVIFLYVCVCVPVICSFCHSKCLLPAPQISMHHENSVCHIICVFFYNLLTFILV